MPDVGPLDHVNSNGHDCRRQNLRPATNAENSQNQRKHSHHNGKPCSSIYKGVHQSGYKWIAKIVVDGEPIYLGTFDNEADAARAYNAAAIVAFGEFARLNQIPDASPAWSTPKLEEIPYTPELRAFYQQQSIRRV
jgi:hypothetical protein